MSNKLSDLTNEVTKGSITANDRFYVTNPEAAEGSRSSFMTATELLYFASGDVTSSGINGNLVIGAEAVTKAMLAADAKRTDVVDITTVSPTITAALHANKTLRVQYDAGSGATLDLSNSAGFLAGDVIYVIQNKTKPVTFTGSGITLVTSRATAAIDSQYATARVTFVSSTRAFIDFATDFLFDIADFPAETARPDATDQIVVNDGTIDSRMTASNFKAIATHTLASGNLDLDLTYVNRTIIVQTTTGNTSLLELQADQFEIGDWITVLPTGDGTIKITTEGGVSVFTTGETVNSDYLLTQYGFVTAYMFSANNWVLLGPVETV